MATALISQLTEAASALGADWLEIEIAASGLSRKIQKANFIGATLTGGGSIVTGGFALTVPATGTAALLATAQTFSALNTFSAGINLGNTTLSNYLQSTWTPTITGSGGNPTISYSTQTGTYTRIGNIVFFSFTVAITTTTGGSGDLRVSLPVAVASGGGGGSGITVGVDLPGTPAGVVFSPVGGQSYGIYNVVQDNAAHQQVQISGLANGDIVTGAGLYFV